MNIDFNQALKNSSAKGKFPPRQNKRCEEGLLFPDISPSFRIKSNASIFTMGSCFARNIEEVLEPLNFKLPTKVFAVPKSEFPHRPNGILNEYTPGTMSQRILYALEGKHFPEETIVASDDLYSDLMLPKDAFSVAKRRIIERRSEIFDVYANLQKSPYVIITLGYIEAWFDNQTKLFINRIPPLSFLKTDPKRFSLKVLDVFESYPLLDKAVAALCDNNIKVILTVSPVPLQRTFTTSDCVIANEFSKSVLRVCAERLCKRFSNVDYFPSYEIARSGGLTSYHSDNIHVKDEIVSKITSFMVKQYTQLE